MHGMILDRAVMVVLVFVFRKKIFYAILWWYCAAIVFVITGWRLKILARWVNYKKETKIQSQSTITTVIVHTSMEDICKERKLLLKRVFTGNDDNLQRLNWRLLFCTH
jgi:hypothetical protein